MMTNFLDQLFLCLVWTKMSCLASSSILDEACHDHFCPTLDKDNHGKRRDFNSLFIYFLG